MEPILLLHNKKINPDLYVLLLHKDYLNKLSDFDPSLELTVFGESLSYKWGLFTTTTLPYVNNEISLQITKFKEYKYRVIHTTKEIDYLYLKNLLLVYGGNNV